MPSVAVKLYSVFFKFLLKHRLQHYIQSTLHEDKNSFGVSSRPDESVAPANPSFTDGVATKDIHIDPLTSLSIRIFLPDTCLLSPDSDSNKLRARVRDVTRRSDPGSGSAPNDPNPVFLRRNSCSSSGTAAAADNNRRNSFSCITGDLNFKSESGEYGGYSPSIVNCSETSGDFAISRWWVCEWEQRFGGERFLLSADCETVRCDCSCSWV